MAEDQQIVDHRVERGPGQRRPQHHLRPLHHGYEAAQRHDQQRRQHREHHDAGIGAGKFRHPQVLPHRHEQILREPHHAPGRHGVEGHEPETHAHGAAQVARPSLAPGARRQRNHRLQHAHAEQPDHDEQIEGEHRGGQFGGTEPADHQHVRGVDRHLRHLRPGDRRAERQCRQHVAAPKTGQAACRFRRQGTVHRSNSEGIRHGSGRNLPLWPNDGKSPSGDPRKARKRMAARRSDRHCGRRACAGHTYPSDTTLSRGQPGLHVAAALPLRLRAGGGRGVAGKRKTGRESGLCRWTTRPASANTAA